MKNNFTIIAGANGSGKTTFALNYFKNSKDIFINADSIATALSPNNPDVSQFRAGKLMVKEIQNCIKNKQNFAIETTLSSKNYIKIIKQLQQDNWQVDMIYLYLPSVNLSMDRVAERVKSGGHNIPQKDILRRYEKSIHHLMHNYFDIVNNIICFDNQDDREIIFSKNSMLNVYNIAKYNKIMELANA